MENKTADSYDVRISRNEEEIQNIWSDLEKLKVAINYRLPLWATFLIAALSSACTGLIVRTFS